MVAVFYCSATYIVMGYNAIVPSPRNGSSMHLV